MMADTTDLDSIWTRVETASTLADLTALLREGRDSESVDESSPEYLQVQRHALTALADLTLDDAATARSLIDEFLLPSCLIAGNDNTERSIETGKLRKLLVKWIEQYAHSDDEPVREHILERLCGLIQHEPTKECLWTIGAIGHRTDTVTARLWSLANRDDAMGDAALGTIASLGMPPETRRAVVALLRQKIETGGLRQGLLYSIQETAGSETLDLILQNIGKPGTDDAKPLSSPFSLLVNSLTKAAAAVPEDADLQKRVWDTIREHRLEATRSGDVAGRCNTEATVVDYAHWLADDSEKGDPTIRRYIYYDRMSELTRPQALSGWNQIERDALLPILKVDATHDTKLTGQYVTTNVRLKEAAFETAFCLGTNDSIDWLESAVGDETSGYVQGEVLELAACLRVETLPASVLELISTERNLERSEGTDELVAHNGAIKLAKSAGTRRAFDTLADFGFTYGGNVLRSVSEAVADVARQRIESGDEDIVRTLLAKAVKHDTPKRHRDVAIDSICHLATRDLVKEDVADDLLQLVNDASLDNFSRCKAVEAVGFLKAGTMGKAAQVFVELASNESNLGWRALEALIRHELFAEHSEMICSRLRLQRSDLVWSLADEQPIVEWQAFLVGLLYRSERDAFATAVSQILERANADAVFQILQSAAHHGSQTPGTVTDALVSRIYERFRAGTVETMLFDSLASISPQRLADEEWDRKWADWLPEGRGAFCNALADADLSERSFGRAITLLTGLALDGIYPVRRAAYRAIASLHAQALIDTCSMWARSSLVRLRKRAAEAIAWIPMRTSAPENCDDWGLSYDVERSVREVAAKSVSERWERHWADEYLKIVLEVGQPTNERLLNAYRYGRALTKLGDDGTIRRLRKHVTESPLPTNVCHWIRRLIKATDDNWIKGSRNWPKPWFNWSGVVEELDGNLVLDNGKSFACRFSLWRMSQTGPSDLGKWGGAVKPSPDASWTEFFDVATAEVEVPGRSKSRVIISRQFTASGEGTRLIIVHGSGHYPTEVDCNAEGAGT